MKTKQPWDVKRYQDAKAHEAALWNKMRDAHEAGKVKRANYLTRQYLGSYHSKYVHAVDAARGLKPHRRKKIANFDAIVSNVDVFRASKELVIFDIQWKNSGHHYRHVKDFGLVNRTRQGMVLSVLKARSNLLPHQFANVGGRNAAVSLAVENLADGFDWCVELDIKNCFPSVSVGVLSEYLPIPDTVIKHVVTCEDCCATAGPNLKNLLDPEGQIGQWQEESDLLPDLIREGRRGLPQGSAVSSYIMELLLMPMLSDLPAEVRLIGYSDNFLVMGKSQDDAVSMQSSLEAALMEHPAGPFKSNSGEECAHGETFDFLGYEFQPSSVGVRLVPTGSNLAEFQYKFDRGLDQLVYGKLSRAKRKSIKNNLRRYVRGWCAAYCLWDKAEAFCERRMKDIAEASAAGSG